MLFSLDIRQAQKGDCFLLHFGTKAKPGLVMIDGGPSNVYIPHLRPRLEKIREKRGLKASDPLPVDLLMVSHVDDDHIAGILELTKDMVNATPGKRLLRVKRFWHNSFDDIVGKNPKELTGAVTAQFGAAALNGSLDADATVESAELPEVVRSGLKVLASIEQGHRLRGDIQKLGVPLNEAFDGKLILAGNQEVAIPGGLRFVAAGPMLPELLKLQKKHDQWLKENQPDAEAALAAYVDKSVPNLSSLVLLVMCEDKKILLTGDARGDKILEGLRTVGALEADGTMEVDVLKVPHHGSSRNLDNEFFERIRAKHYVFSGNGEHGNPDREAIEMLYKARGGDPFSVHLTYSVAEIDEERKKDWEKEQAKEKKKDKPARSDWAAAKHSLAAFFTKHPLVPGQVLHTMTAAEPHVIDLLEKLGY